MKTTNLIYLLFVTATLFSAGLLFVAVHLKNPLDMKYRETVASICEKNAQLNTEAEVLAAYPKLKQVKAKISTLKAIRCQIQSKESSPIGLGNENYLTDQEACKKRLKQLVNEIHYLLRQMESNNNYASMLQKENLQP